MSRRLLPLDRHVLEALPQQGQGIRAKGVLEQLVRVYSMSEYDPVIGDARSVLRSLEAMGLAKEVDGWWTRT